jgi:MOSC domain-containing protein YiiM
VAREQAVAIPGVGLEGDRYALKQGTFFKPEPDFELTLIEAEAIEALRRDYNVELAPGEARRNIVTRGVSLNHLVGREFRVGTVLVRGIRLCEPCEHLQKLTGKQLIKGLLHRGGLRAQILTEGIVHVGDAVTPTMQARGVTSQPAENLEARATRDLHGRRGSVLMPCFCIRASLQRLRKKTYPASRSNDRGSIRH